jgi:hypothetical protein
MKRIVLEDCTSRKCGRAPRGELTLEDAAERAKKQSDAERVKQQEVVVLLMC